MITLTFLEFYKGDYEDVVYSLLEEDAVSWFSTALKVLSPATGRNFVDERVKQALG